MYVIFHENHIKQMLPISIDMQNGTRIDAFWQEPEFTVLVGFVLLMLSRIVFCWIIGCPFVLVFPFFPFHLANLLPILRRFTVSNYSFGILIILRSI